MMIQTKTVTRRQMLAMLSLSAIGTTVATVATACGGGAGAPTANAPSPSGPAAGTGGDVTLEIGSAGDDSKYDKDKLEAPSGSKITVKFTNNSKPAANKLVNWVLVKPYQLFNVVNDGLVEG